MSYGAGLLVAEENGAADIIDPRDYAVGSIAETYQKYPHIGKVLPAMGYSSRQCDELEATIANAAPDVIVDASPATIERVIKTAIPLVRVRYQFKQLDGNSLIDMVAQILN